MAASNNLSERERRQLVLLKIREDQGYRTLAEPEHDGDVWAGLVWLALGVYWRPKEWELQWPRTKSQSWSHTFRRLREKGYVGYHGEPKTVGYGITLDSSGYYYFTGDGYDVAASLTVPADLARRCGYRSCGRWLPPNESGDTCQRCRFSRDYRESGGYRGRTSSRSDARGGPGYERFVRGGWGDVTSEGLVSREHAATGMDVREQLLKRGGRSLLDHWRDTVGQNPPRPLAELTA